jgi:spore germination protein YaaH
MDNYFKNQTAVFLRVCITAAAVFIIGFSQLFSVYIFEGETFSLTQLIVVVLGLLLPFLIFNLKEKSNTLWVISCIGTGVIFLLFLFLDGKWLIFSYLFLPTVIMGNFLRKQRLWERISHITALVSWIFAWGIPYSGIVGYYILSIVGIILIGAILVPFLEQNNSKTDSPINEMKKTDAKLSPSTNPKSKNIVKSISFTFYLLFVMGASATMFRIFLNFAWIDPNPVTVGSLRTNYARAYAPWDSIGLGLSILVYILIIILKFPKDNRNINKLGFLQLGITAISWIIVWEVPTIPFFVFATIGVSTFLGGLLYINYNLAISINNSNLNSNNCIVLWIFILIVYLGGVVIGFVVHGAIHRNMYLIDFISWFFAALILLGGFCGLLAGSSEDSSEVISKANSKNGNNSNKSEKSNGKALNHNSRTSKKPTAALLIFMVVFCSLYTLEISQAHNTEYQKYDNLYMWGLPPGGKFSDDWCKKISHVSLGGISFNRTTGEVTKISINETLADYYRAYGIKIMPTIGLVHEELWHMLMNTDGRLDTFCKTFREMLLNSSADGVSIDFEMLETPEGEINAEDKEWLNVWKRLSEEVFHPTSGKQFILANYFGVGGRSTKEYVNSYFNYVDIHIQNCYESHWHLGAQGATTIASHVASGMLEIFNKLTDKTEMKKIVLGLPFYGYNWVWGIAGAIPFLDEYKADYHSTSERFEAYDVTMERANASLIRWDPFSGGQWFEYTNEDGKRCVAYQQGTEQLIQILNAVKGYQIGGLMFWPGGNDPYSGLYEIL